MEDFNQLLLELAKQSQTPQYEETPEYDEADNYSEEKPEYDEEFYTLQMENEELKKQLSELEETQKINDTQDEYFEYMQTQDMDDPNYAMQLIMADDLFEGLKDNPTSSATWLKRKDNSVNLEGMSGRILSYLETLPPSIRESLLATSGNDSDVHAKGSKHYRGAALDLRFNPEAYEYIKNDPNFKNSGLNMLDPNHGTARHLHIEEKMFGGKYKAIY